MANAQSTEQQSEQPKRPRRFVLIAGVLILAIGIFIVWRVFFAKPEQPANVVALSGRVEGDDSAVAGKTSGRLLEVNFREGDLVKAGDVIAVLDDTQVRARENQARAGVSQAEARLRSAHQQIAILNEQFRQSGVEKLASPKWIPRGACSKPERNSPPPRRNWRSSNLPINSPLSIETPTRAWSKPGRSPKGRASRLKPPPMRKPLRWLPPNGGGMRRGRAHHRAIQLEKSLISVPYSSP